MTSAPLRPVLVVEDEAAIRELLRLHVELARFTLEETGDGRQALDAARARAFDLILLDATVRGEPIELTKQEFDLLYLLAASPASSSAPAGRLCV